MKQIVSDKRVRDRGEVFTNREEVIAMLDMINNGRINCEDMCLEPACGTGNFLSEIMIRKIRHAAELSGNSKEAMRYRVFIAASTCYGAEIQKESAEECRSNLLKLILTSKETRFLKNETNFIKALSFVFEKNIINCNFLNGEVEDEEDDEKRMAKISEWSLDVTSGLCLRWEKDGKDIRMKSWCNFRTLFKRGTSFFRNF